MVLGYPACLLPALQAPDSPIKTDIGAASWIASATGTASMLGILMSSALMESCGRKIAFILDIVSCVIGWLFIYFGNNIPTLVVGRVLCGLTGGATTFLGAIVIGEYTAPKYRGIFISLKTTALCVGTMIVHIMGHYVNWRTVAMIAVWPQVIAILIAYTWPESPAWLVLKKQYAKSERAFYWLRGRDEEAVREFEELVQAQKEKLCASPNKVSVWRKFCMFFRKLRQKNFIKPTTIMVLTRILIEVCGRHFFPTYAVEIMSTLTSDSSQGFYYILFIDFIITASTTVSTVLIKIMNRRTLFLSSGIASSIVLLVLCLYLFLTAKNIIPVSNSWVPVSGLVLYFILVNLGCTMIPHVLLGEIFPLEHRGSGSTVIGIIGSVCFLLSLKATPYMLLTLNNYGTFFIYGVIMMIVLLLLYLIMPETKDKTLQQIEDFFDHGSFNVKDVDAGKRIVNDD